MPVLLRLSFIAAPLIATLLTAAGTLLPPEHYCRRPVEQRFKSSIPKPANSCPELTGSTLHTEIVRRPPSAVRHPPSLGTGLPEDLEIQDWSSLPR